MNAWVLSIVRRLLAVTVVIILTTVGARQASAFEVKTDDDGDMIRWEEKTIDLCLGAEFLERFGVEQAVLAAEGAAAAWSGIKNAPEIRIIVSDTREFDPRRLSGCVHLAKSWDNRGNELALTYSASDPAGYIRATDIVLNGQHRFGTAGVPFGNDRFDLQSVLTHEMGHLLGLAENSADVASTMHPDIGRDETFQRDITDDDRAGVEFIYAAESERSAAACAYGGRAGLSSSLWVVLVVTMLGFRRRGRIVQFGGG